MILKRNGGLIKIWSLFTFFIGLFILHIFAQFHIGNNATLSAWLTLAFCVSILSIVMLVKNKLPKKKQVLISLLFGIILFLAYTVPYQRVSFSSVQVPLVTVLCALASFSIFNTYDGKAIKLLRNTSLKSICLSIGIGIVVGIVWGIGNLFLSIDEPNLHITLYPFLLALSPGIYEEIAFRALIFAVCLYFMKGEITTRKQQFTCWFMMIIPHVLVHTPDMFINSGLITGIVSTIILTVLFGLPFAFLQRKWDLTSAMIAHGVVMAIRFCMHGIPVFL
jgi:hypothetical protein